MFSTLRGCFCVYRRTETCWRTKGVTTGLQRKYAAYSVLFQSGLPLKLHSSKGSFRQKARLSPLSISVWFRCRQRGQPFGRFAGIHAALRRASLCSALEQFQSEIALTRIIQLKPAPHNGSCILAIEQPLCLRIHKADGLAFQQGATHILEPDVVAHECGRHRQTQ